MIDMVLKVRWALEELGISVPWNDDGPVCGLVVPYGHRTIHIRREFSAEAARLIAKTILVIPFAQDASGMISEKVDAMETRNGTPPIQLLNGCLAFTEVIEILAADVTPLYMGQLLDRTTKQIILAAESIGVLVRTDET
jgi:hypothetical protein